MRRKSLVVTLIVLTVVLLVVTTSCAKKNQNETDERDLKIGFSIQDISNPIWADMWTHMEAKAKELSVDITLSDCQADPAKQIASLENFIEGGYDAIIVHAFDAESASATLQQAKKKGIKIVAYDTFVEEADCHFGVDNHAVGMQIAKNAGAFIDATFPDGVCEIGICNYPLNQVCLDRAEGIVTGLAEYAPNAEIVAQAQAGYVDEGIVVGENFMQAHPNMKVICGIDDAGLLGVYESVKAAGKLADDFGLFGIDALPETLELIASGDIFRSTILLDMPSVGQKMVQYSYDLVDGKEVEEYVNFEMVNIDINNVADFIK